MNPMIPVGEIREHQDPQYTERPVTEDEQRTAAAYLIARAQCLTMKENPPDDPRVQFIAIIRQTANQVRTGTLPISKIEEANQITYSFSVTGITTAIRDAVSGSMGSTVYPEEITMEGGTAQVRITIPTKRIRNERRRSRAEWHRGVAGRSVSRAMYQGRPVVGPNAFCHEAGIHQEDSAAEVSPYAILRPEDLP